MEKISICLSDIPQEVRKKSDKNGKVYCEIIVDKRREKDQFGNDLTVYISQTKEQRNTRENKTYIGNGKTYDFSRPTPDATPIPNDENKDIEDLPF